MTLPAEALPFCAEGSRVSASPPIGTAPAQTTSWLFLEYDRPWSSRAVEDNDLPPAVQDWLGANLAALPESRLVFIKRGRPRPGPKSFYLAVARAADSRLHRRQFQDFNELLTGDLPSAAAGSPSPEWETVPDPLILVCANGRRDRCCPKFGLPVFKKLSKLADREAIWQSTHLGGHRYAPVTAVFPDGLYFRLLDPQVDPARLLAALRSGEILLDSFRGRTCYDGVVQAADYFARRATGYRRLEPLCLEQSTAEGNRGQVIFGAGGKSGQIVVTLKREETAPLLVGCTQGKFKVEPRYRLVDLRIA